MNPFNVILLQIFVCALMAAPVAHFLDPDGAYFSDLARLADRSYIWVAWGWTVYAFVVMVIAYWLGGMARQFARYAQRPAVQPSRRTCLGLWLATFVAAALCLAVVIYQTGGRIPLFELSESTKATEVSSIRSETGESIDMKVLNVGRFMLVPINLLLATAFLRNPMLIAASAALWLLLGTFSLEKGPMAMSLFALLFFWMLWRPPSMGQNVRVAIYVGTALLVVVGTTALTRWASGSGDILVSIYTRVLYGTITDLPYYFERFDGDLQPLTSMLPPYVQKAFFDQHVESPAAFLITEYARPWAVRAGIIGLANSFYVGEAYALGGVPFVLLSPFLVTANVYLINSVFYRLEKSLLTTYAYAFSLYLIFQNIFGGIGSYVFSSIHLFLMLCVFMWLVFGWGRRKNPGALAPVREPVASPQPASGAAC